MVLTRTGKKQTNSVISIPRRDYILPRSENFHNRAIIREVGTAICDGRCANCYGAGTTGRRHAPCVSVGIASSDNNVKSTGSQVGNDMVKCQVDFSSERHGNDRGTTTCGGLVFDPIKTGNPSCTVVKRVVA